MIKQTWRCLAVAVLTLLLVSCNDVSSLSFEESSPAPPPAADVTPDVATTVPETVPIEVTAVPPALEAGPASCSRLPTESSLCARELRYAAMAP